MPVSNTIKEFRQDVLAKGGPQIAGMYEVMLMQNNGNTNLCYPMTVVFPGRMFTFYDHDIWGPSRKIPYKRGYTQCHMTFIVYQDWAERTFIEQWMNSIVVNAAPSTAQVNPVGVSVSPTALTDYINYLGGCGQISIKCISTDKSRHTREIILKEAYPAAISQMTLSSDGSGYATFTTTFQFNNYEYREGNRTL